VTVCVVLYLATVGTHQMNYYIPVTKNCKTNFYSWKTQILISTIRYTHSYIPSPCAECDDSLQFSAASSIPTRNIVFDTSHYTSTFHHSSYHLFLGLIFCLLFPNSYKIHFWEFYFLPLSVHAQNNTIYVTLSSLLLYDFKNSSNSFIS
jgi:hypothetical protein